MRHAGKAFVLATAVLIGSVASAEGMAGNTQFFIGQTYLGDDWKPFD